MINILTFTEWLRKINTPASTTKTYGSIINEFTRYIGDEITEDKITEFILLKHERYYAGAIKKYLQYKRVDVDWNKIRDEIRVIRKRDIPPRELSFEEVKTLVNNLDYPYNKITLLQWEFGCRIREVLNLSCENLFLSKLENREETVKVILKTKCQKTRTTFTISKEATLFLKDYVNKKGLVFPRGLIVKKSRIENHDEGMIEERIIRSVYWVMWHKIKRKAYELFKKSLSTHWFRHSRIIYLYEKGYDIKTIQRFTGHSSLDMLDKYLISAGRDAKRLAEDEKSKGDFEW